MKVKKIIIIVLILILTITVLPINTKASTLREFEEQVTKYQNELNDKNSQIAVSKKELEEVQAKMTEIEKQIRDAESEITRLEEEIQKNNEEIANKKEESQKIIEHYQIANGENIYLEYAFGATDITDMIYRLSIVEQLTDYNDKVMKELTELVKQSKEKQKELEEKKVELNKLRDELKAESQKIKGNISSMEGMVPNIKGQLSYYQERVAYYKRVGCEPDDEIGIDCDRPRATGGGGGAGVAGASGFVSPLSYYSYISTGFYWDGSSGHKGIDYAAGCGTPVKAVATGRVYYVGSGKDIYGAKMILIVHNYNGRLVFSQYAHLSGYAVGSNQDVYAGQVIGYVGNTGWSTGCHLHLEMSNDVGWDYNRPGNYWTYVGYITSPYNYVPH